MDMAHEIDAYSSGRENAWPAVDVIKNSDSGPAATKAHGLVHSTRFLQTSPFHLSTFVHTLFIFFPFPLINFFVVELIFINMNK